MEWIMAKLENTTWKYIMESFSKQEKKTTKLVIKEDVKKALREVKIQVGEIPYR